MSNDDVFAQIDSLEMALTSALFETDRPGFMSLPDQTRIGIVQTGDSFRCEVTLRGKAYVSDGYATLQEAQDGLRKAIRNIIAALVDAGTPPATSEMFMN
jgi:hypothetical protein